MTVVFLAIPGLWMTGILGAATACTEIAPTAAQPEPLHDASATGTSGDGEEEDDDEDKDGADDADETAPTTRTGEKLGPPYPVILVHGFSGWDEVFGGVDYFYGVVDTYRARGVDVTAPALPPYASSAARAAVLAEVISDVLARTHKQKVHLIAHSQGGIDCRVLLTDLGYADRVASLVTVSSPHRGSAVADAAEWTPAGVMNPAGQLMAWLLAGAGGAPSDETSWLANVDVNVAYDADVAAAIASMRTSSMTAFNETHPDPPGVPIFSVAGVSNLLSTTTPACDGGVWDVPRARDVVDPFFAASGLFLSNTEGGNPFAPTPNDGLITVASARWGTFLGCIPADHADEIGQVADRGPGLVSGFDHLAFYVRLLEHLRSVEDAAGMSPPVSGP